MKLTAAALLALALTGAALPASRPPVVLANPGFPPPASEVTPTGARLELVSSRYSSPIAPRQEPPSRLSFVPRAFRGNELDRMILQGHKVFAIYGGRYLLAGNTVEKNLPFAFDLANLARPPAAGEYEELMFAREAGGVIYVSNTHLTYATATNGRNAYVIRLPVQSAPEIIKLRGDRLEVRTYDRKVVARIVR